MKILASKKNAPGPKHRTSRAPEKDTRTRLVEAAAKEFNSGGYFGTDTNRIARLAGFAPQTFYRHFSDKLDAFLAVYDRWQAEEAAAVAAAVRKSDSAKAARAAADVLISHHVAWATFRRSLRLLAIDVPRARTARAAGRSRQLAELAKLPGNARRPAAEIAAAILTVERLCDALADAEPQDLGLTPAQWTQQVRRAVASARGEG